MSFIKKPKVNFVHSLNLTAEETKVNAVKEALNNIVSKLDANDIILLGKLADDSIYKNIALNKLRSLYQ